MRYLLKEGEIERIIPPDGGGMTKEVHLIKHKGNQYILRQCPNIRTADKYERVYHSLERFGFLPELLWRDRTKMIFKYLPGRDCRVSDAPKVARDVGKIAGEINSVHIPFKNYDFDKNFFTKLEFIRKKHVISKDKAQEIKARYYELKRKVKPKLALDANDITMSNFRISRGRVYFVDIEAIKPVPRGVGIAKAMLKWFRTPVQRERFFSGYDSVSDSKFLTPEYKDFVYLYFIINNIYNRIENHQLKQSNIDRLDQLLAGEKL